MRSIRKSCCHNYVTGFGKPIMKNILNLYYTLTDVTAIYPGPFYTNKTAKDGLICFSVWSISGPVKCMTVNSGDV